MEFLQDLLDLECTSALEITPAQQLLIYTSVFEYCIKDPPEVPLALISPSKSPVPIKSPPGGIYSLYVF